MEKASDSFLKRANYFEEKVSEISEQRMVENRELLDENIKLRKRLKETQRQLQLLEADKLQKATPTTLKDSQNQETDIMQRQRPKSAMARTSFGGGQLIKGSTSRLIKSVSVSDQATIQKLNKELELTKSKTKEQNVEIKRLKNMVNTYRDEKLSGGARSIRPSSATSNRRRWI